MIRTSDEVLAKSRREPLTAHACLPLLTAIVLLTSLTWAETASAAEPPRQGPLVPLSRLAPSILQDMRYAGENNFTGSHVPGYDAAECWLRPAVAKALAKVQEDLEASGEGLSLKVFDCYRPRRAVRAFVDWVHGRDGPDTRRYYPSTPRSQLVARGYIGAASSHARGIAIDLTLVRTSPAAAADAATAKPSANTTDCTHTSGNGADGPGSLDMGTTFDCFDVKSATAHPGITPAQREARAKLKRAMERRGFTNYSREWWHFTFSAADDSRAFDIPITEQQAPEPKTEAKPSAP